MEAAQSEHGDIAWWDHVTDVNYTDGQYYKTLRQPPTVHVVDFSGYDGPLDENGFPVGLPKLFRTYYGPADFTDTVNILGKRLYAKQWPMPNDKGIVGEIQMNALHLCTRPGALRTARRT